MILNEKCRGGKFSTPTFFNIHSSSLFGLKRKIFIKTIKPEIIALTNPMFIRYGDLSINKNAIKLVTSKISNSHLENSLL